MSNKDRTAEIVTEITKRLTQEGKLVEAGWAAFRHLVVPADASDVQVDEMRLAFFAGADHLFTSMMSMLDPGEDPTTADLTRMDKMHAELAQFRDSLRERVEQAGRPPSTLRPPAQRLGDGPVEESYREMLQGVARALDQTFNKGAKGADRKLGFVLLLFEFGEAMGRCSYISNGADRRDIVTMFREQIKRFEGQPDVRGTA